MAGDALMYCYVLICKVSMETRVCSARIRVVAGIITVVNGQELGAMLS